MKKKLKKIMTKVVGQKLNLMHYYAPKKAVHESFELFLTPRKGKVQPWQEEFLNTAHKEKLEVDGLDLQTYYWKKGKEKVLLVHGWESNTHRWKDLIDLLLERNFSVISLDAPGHGDSEGRYSNVPIYAQAVAKLVDEHQIDYAVGHSLGGFTLLYQEVHAPMPPLKKMVLLAPATQMVNIVNDFQSILGLNNSLMEDFEEQFEDRYHYRLSDFSIAKEATECPIPSLFIHDLEDTIVGYQESKEVSDLWNNSELVLTKGLGHGLKSEKVNHTIVDYLSKKEEDHV